MKIEQPSRQFRFDEDFLQALEKDPVSALKELGVEPTPEIVDAIRELDFGPLYRIAAAFPGALPSAEPTLGVRPIIGPEQLVEETGLIFP